MRYATLTIIPAMLLLCAGCFNTGVVNGPGHGTVYEDVGSVGRDPGVGIESQDISSMADQMGRDILATPAFANRQPGPRVIIDAEYFKNESSSIINKNLITDKLRVELNRAAGGKMVFVGRENIDMVEKERLLKENGVVTPGTGGNTPATAGADYRLSGRIASLDKVSSKTGETSRYHQITFELVDLVTGIITWSNQYEFRKSAQDDNIYR